MDLTSCAGTPFDLFDPFDQSEPRQRFLRTLCFPRLLSSPRIVYLYEILLVLLSHILKPEDKVDWLHCRV